MSVSEEISSRFDNASAYASSFGEELHDQLITYGIEFSSDSNVTLLYFCATVILFLLSLTWILIRRARSRVMTSESLAEITRGPKLVAFTALLAFLAILGAWSYHVPLSSATVAPGLVTPPEGRQTISHLEGGIVEVLHVREGAIVKVGDPLITLDKTEALAKQAELTESFLFLLATESRLEAELNGEDEIVMPDEFYDWAGEHDEHLVLDQQVLMSRRAETNAARARIIAARVSQLEEEASGLKESTVAQLEQLRLVREEVKTIENLLKKGLGRRAELFERQHEAVGLQAEIAEKRSLIAKNLQQVLEAEGQLLAFFEDFEATANSELLQTRQKLSEIRGQLPSRKNRLARTVIRAPIDGQVINVVANTKDGVVRPGDVVMEIVPFGGELVVDARVAPTDIDRVEIGMPARLSLTAYKQRNLPQIFGTLRSISGDVITDDKTGEVYFLARVAVDPSEIDQIEGVSINPGMPVEVMLIDEERSLAMYLLDPVLDSFSRSFRED